jgi:hypothetical protein
MDVEALKVGKSLVIENDGDGVGAVEVEVFQGGKSGGNGPGQLCANDREVCDARLVQGQIKVGASRDGKLAQGC